MPLGPASDKQEPATATSCTAGLWQAVAVDPTPAVSFDDLTDADLLLERVYRGGTAGNTADDPLARLLPVGNRADSARTDVWPRMR
jgi:hypothetical protein